MTGIHEVQESFSMRAAKMAADGFRPIAVVAFAEDGWDEELLKKHGKIFTLCWFDASQPTHACELRPSYYLNPYTVEGTKTMPEGTPDEEQIDEIWRSLPDGAEGFYVHCSAIDALDGVRMTLLSAQFEADATDEDIEEAMHANPPYNATMQFQLEPTKTADVETATPAP